MKKKTIKTILFAVFCMGIFYSCITKEYQLSEVALEEDWSMNARIPLFYGNFDIEEIINEDSIVVFNTIAKEVSGKPYFPLKTVCGKSLSVLDYDLSKLEEQQYIDSAGFRLIANNLFSLPMRLQFTFKSSSGSKYFYIFVVPASSKDFSMTGFIKNQGLDVIKNVVSMDFNAEFVCSNPNIPKLISIDPKDYFNFSLIIEGKVSKTDTDE